MNIRSALALIFSFNSLTTTITPVILRIEAQRITEKYLMFKKV